MHTTSSCATLRRLSCLIALGLVASLPLSASRAQVTEVRRAPVASTALRDTVPLSLDVALALVGSESEEVRLARSAVRMADAQVRATRADALPQLAANASYLRTFATPFAVGPIILPDSLQFRPDPSLSTEERLRYLEDNAQLAGLAGLGQLFSSLPFGQPNTYSATVSLTQPLYTAGRVGAALKIAREFKAASEYELAEQLAEAERNRVRRSRKRLTMEYPLPVAGD